MLYLDSRCLLAVDYHSGTGLLRIWFRSGGGPYHFYGVPGHHYRGLLKATDSHGRYYHDHLKGRYQSPGHSPKSTPAPTPTTSPVVSDRIRSNPTFEVSLRSPSPHLPISPSPHLPVSTMSRPRNGRIARLPRAIREELNQRLDEGQSGQSLVAWLNTLPEVISLADAEHDGKPLREQNLSEWRKGGYRDW